MKIRKQVILIFIFNKVEFKTKNTNGHKVKQFIKFVIHNEDVQIINIYETNNTTKTFKKQHPQI